MTQQPNRQVALDSEALFAALKEAFSWIARLPDGRDDSTATCAYVPREVYARLERACKFPEGDPAEVQSADSRAESQSALNGPSGSPTSPSGRDPSKVAPTRDDAPYQVCDQCGRKSWAAVRTALCGMPQPDGSRCSGAFRDSEVAIGSGHTLDAATYEAVRRALNHVDATDPCPLCDSWPEHEDSCVMAAPELDALLGRGLVLDV